jgi:DnaJ-class molecular chaperone
MADEHDIPEESAAAPCHPCRGTGSVISGLGGEQRQLPCPWCGGTGVREPGRDAQAHAPAGRPAA